MTNRYVHGPGVDEPLVWYDGPGVTDGSRRFLYADHQSSIIGITDTAGSVVAVNTYDSYGIGDPLNFGRFAYTGQTRIPELGLYYYKARFYNPHLGRFMQTDPVGYDDQMNLYAYASNDPINLLDPTGQEGKGFLAALLDNTSVSAGISLGVNAEISTPMGGVAIGTGEISLSGKTTLAGTDQMEVTTAPPHAGVHLGGPGIGMPTVTTTIMDRDATGPDQFREEVSEGGFKETKNAAGEIDVSAQSRPASITVGVGLKLTIEVDIQAAFLESAVLESPHEDR